MHEIMIRSSTVTRVSTSKRAPVLFERFDVLQDRGRAPVLRDHDRRPLLVGAFDQRRCIALELRDRRDVVELHGIIVAPNLVREPKSLARELRVCTGEVACAVVAMS